MTKILQMSQCQQDEGSPMKDPDGTRGHHNQNDVPTTTTTTTTTTLKVRFYLIRHGESTSNRLGIFAGQQDVPLTEEGLFQAHALGRRRGPSKEGGAEWRDRSVGCWVFSSDLQRAVRTLTGLLQTSGRHDLVDTVRLDERLRERCYGPREGMPHHMSEEEARTLWQSQGIEPPIYETDEMVWQRCSKWLISVLQEIQEDVVLAATTPRRLLRRQEGNEGNVVVLNVLVSSHAGVLRVMLQHLFSKEELIKQGGTFDDSRHNNKMRLVIPNTSLSVIEFEIVPPTTTTIGRDKRMEEEEEDKDNDGTVLLRTARLLQLTSTDHLGTSIEIHDD